MITYCNIGVPGDRLDIHNLDTPGSIYLDSFSLGMPVVREDTSSKPRSHGMDDYTDFFGARTIGMSGWVFENDLTALADTLDNLKAHFTLYGSAQKQIVFQRLGRDYKEFCYIRMASFDAPLDVPGNSVAWSASLVAGDPRIYRRMDPDDPATVSFKSSATITNGGSGINSPVVIRIIGPAEVGAGVKNSSLSVERYFTLRQAISKGTTVEIDTGAKTVMKNGKSAPEVLATDSWFWHLAPGTNHLHRMGKMKGHVEVDWREARI